MVRSLMDFIRYPIYDRQAILDLCCEVEGWENLEKALKESTGSVIVLGGHIGGWEYSGAYLVARGIPLAAVGREQREAAITELMLRAREAVGIEHIPRSRHGNRKLVECLKRKNSVVGLVSDQNAGRNGIFVPLFGKLASSFQGPAFFAIRYNLPIVPVFAVWKGLKYKMLIGDRVEVVRVEDQEESVRLTLTNIQKVYEEVITKYPDQNLWLHRRWKTRPPEESGASVS